MTAAADINDGKPNLYGYGAIGSGGQLIAVATHPGVEDSAAQGGDPASDVFHSHNIATTTTTACASGTAVQLTSLLLAFEETGTVSISGDTLTVTGVPTDDVALGTFTDSYLSFTLTLEGIEVCVNTSDTFLS